MYKLLLGLLCSLAVSRTLKAQSTDEPDAGGYVTAVASDSFSVAGRTVLLDAKAKLYTVTRGKTRQQITHLPPLYLGELVELWGKLDRKSDVFHARFVHVFLPYDFPVSGSGIIEISDAAHEAGTFLLRADGRSLRLSKTSKVTLDGGLKSLEEITPNQWIGYRGVENTDGVVEVSEAAIQPNILVEVDRKRRARSEFTPHTSNGVEGKQAEGMFGTDVKLLPLHEDTAVQARVERIGMALIPAFQRRLPDQEPTKIHFRFYVVDAEKMRGGRNLASGIILVPYTVVRNLQDDSQLAAVLAESVAATLEDEEVTDRAGPSTRKQVAILGVSAAAGGLAGVAVAAPFLGSSLLRGDQLSREQQQSGRVSLWLMNDAGFDVTQAPLAWWKFVSKEGDSLANTPMPLRTQNLYLCLGTTWRNKLAN